MERETFEGYIECALWTNEWDNMSMGDFDPETRNKLRRMLHLFVEAYGHLKMDSDGDWSLFGHNVWLTQNGHGAGFWDGRCVNGDELTEACEKLGGIDLYIGDDGLIYS